MKQRKYKGPNRRRPGRPGNEKSFSVGKSKKKHQIKMLSHFRKEIRSS